MYVLSARWRVLLQIHEREKEFLERVSACQTGGGRRLPLALAAWINDERFANAAQLFQNAVDAEVLPLLGEFPLQ